MTVNKKPNIILIQADQMSSESLGIYGNTIVRTPYLEKFSDTGMTYNNAFCNYPACSPSRSSMFTGRYPHTLRAHANHMELNPMEVTLAHVLKDAGYRTALIGKNHAFLDGNRSCYYPNDSFGKYERCDELHKLFDFVKSGEHGHFVDGYENDPEVMGAHKWAIENCWYAPLAHGHNPFPYNKCGSYLLGDSAVQYLQNCKSDSRPFFLWLSYPDPHTPYQAPEPYSSMYDPEKVPLPPRDSLEGKPEHQKVAHLMDAMDKADDSLIAKVRAIHYGMINAVDDSIGRVLKTVEDIELLQDTIIVFTADHGDSMGAHGLIQKQNCFYDSFTRVPFIISSPSRIEPGRTDNLLELVDLLPTLLDLSDIQVPYGVQGKSHAAFLTGGEYISKEFIVMESGESGPFMRVSDIVTRPENPLDESCYVWCAYRDAYMGKGKSVRTREWKLNVYSNGEGELYDLINDPDELHNLYSDTKQRSIVSELEKKLLHWCMEMEDTIPQNKTIRVKDARYL